MIIFLGDSITELGSWKTLLSEFDIVNYGVSGDKTYQIIDRVEELFNKEAHQLFLLVGINDLGENRLVTDILKDYAKLINLLLNNKVASSIHLVSVLPIQSNLWEMPGMTSENINNLNSGIMNLSQDNNLSFVNIHNMFTDVRNELKQEYTTDGLHLNSEGYKVYAQEIRKYL